jgi:hypothetical protein
MPPVFYGLSLIILCVVGFIIVATIFWVWMLIDCIMNKRITDTQKIAWIIALIFTHLIGALLYLCFGRSSQKVQNSYQPYVQPQARPVPQAPMYNPYQQGYQAARPAPPPSQPGFVPPAPVVPYEQNPPLDYEQPQAMYPHEQNNNE